jgi:hypothetical protein
MGKKIVLKDDSKNLVKADLKIFTDHINRYHKTGTTIHEERGHYFTVNNAFRKKLKKMSEG